MHSHSRSRDATLSNKSCKLRSAETKYQSTITSSPTPKPKKTITNKAKQKTIKNKTIIKSSAKLNQFFNQITAKLEQFDKQSVLQTPSTSSDVSCNESRVMSSVSYSSTQEYGYNKSTAAIMEKVKYDNQSLLNTQRYIDEGNFCKKINQDNMRNSVDNYGEIFDGALSSPHCLSNFMVKRRQVQIGKTSRTKEFREFKRQQCQNWQHINSQLNSYLNDKQQMNKQHIYNKIQQRLLKQGLSNYRWLQLQDKLTLEQFQSISKQQNKQTYKQQNKYKQQANKIQINSHYGQVKQEQNPHNKQRDIDDQPLEPMLLKNYNWEKYIWDDQASSTSDLQCNSRVNSDVQFLHVNFNNETDQVEENVQLIMGWLLDQFVVDLAHKLDSNNILGIKTQPKTDKTKQNLKNQDQYDNNFIKTINQICEDSNTIRSLHLKKTQKPIPQFYQDALLQLKLYNPRLNNNQIKEQLIKMICNREVQIHQLFLIEEEQQQQWIKMSFLYELEQIIWEGIVMEQTCRLWMG